MKHMTNFPVYDGCLDEFGSTSELASQCEELGLDGLEVIWDFAPCSGSRPPDELIVGYHLMFWSTWMDFWLQDRPALLGQFGDWETVKEYYRGETPADMVSWYRRDLDRAARLNAEYVVFHVSEVSTVESFTYSFKYSDEEVIDASIELINELLDQSAFEGAFLVENQWWPGLQFTDPALTRRLLDGIAYDNKGIMLDTGHLLSTNTSLRTQAEALSYIRDRYDSHGELASLVRGVHLHQSLSGEYVEQRGFRLPDDFGDTFWERFSRCYKHILNVDRHEPWDDPGIAELLAHIGPSWVNHELSASPRKAHAEAVRKQMQTLLQGGLFS